MPSPSNSLNNLHIFHDSVESHIRELASLRKSKTLYGELLIPGKLPTDIQRNLVCEHSSTQWILSDLMAAILKEIRILECGQHNPLKQSPRSSTAAFPLLLSSKDQFNKKQSRDTLDSKRKPQCVFCKGLHPAHSCSVITDYQKWLDIVKDSALCYNCLAHHQVSQCPSKFRCKKCKKKHHTSLCNSKPTKGYRRSRRQQLLYQRSPNLPVNSWQQHHNVKLQRILQPVYLKQQSPQSLLMVSELKRIYSLMRVLNAHLSLWHCPMSYTSPLCHQQM